MCRKARIKSEEAIYHVMARCGSDINIFENSEDKIKFLEIVRKYKEIFIFEIYAYCVMNTHYHFLMSANGLKGFVSASNRRHSVLPGPRTRKLFNF